MVGLRTMEARNCELQVRSGLLHVKICTIFLYLSFCAISAFGQDVTIGLQGYYPFNENASDESGNGNDGVINGVTLVTDRFGKPNSVYGFDGVDDRMLHQLQLT